MVEVDISRLVAEVPLVVGSSMVGSQQHNTVVLLIRGL